MSWTKPSEDVLHTVFLFAMAKALALPLVFIAMHTSRAMEALFVGQGVGI
ncbi:hypothetical protein [Actinophytocola sp.]